jgi:chromosome partitioning protein
MKIIALCNQKGGVGKTTSAVNLAASLARAGEKVLLIDMDPQGNAGSGLGINKYRVEKSIYHVLLGETPIAQVVRSTDVPGLEVAPSNRDLVGAELELVTAYARETKLRAALSGLQEAYDWVLIDCPPSLNLLTVNALAAAESVLIPVQCEYYALEGISELIHTIELVQQSLNPTLYIEGVLLTMFDARNNLAHQVVDEIRRHFREKVFNSLIPRNVRLSESPSHGLPVYLYDPKSIGAERYQSLASELVARRDQVTKGGLTLIKNEK